MKAYKGFNEDMTCRGYQYKEGETYHEDAAELCVSGFHACKNPIDCLKYYNPAHSVYHEVNVDELSEKTDNLDSKICGKTIKIGARLDVLGMCQAHFEYVKSHTKKSEISQNNSSLAAKDCSSLAAQDYSALAAQDYSSLAAKDFSSLAARNYSALAAQNSSALAAQNYSSLAAQDYSSLAAQDYSALAAQNYSALSAGKNSVIAAFNSRAKGDMGTLIALAKRKYTGNGWEITDFKAGIIDGENLKPNVWYELKNGEFVEVRDEQID